MFKKEFSMEFGNFICKFGKQVLIDYLEELIIPAFLGKNLSRTYGQTKYFFDNVKVVHISNRENDNVVGIIGRIIKDTILEREQVYEDGVGLRKDRRSIQSSPSAVFLLIINNHRLMYIKETRDAPPKETFGHTYLNFLRKKHNEFIEKKFKELNDKIEDSKKTTKKELLSKFPQPTLDIIPLTSEGDIQNFLKKFDLLKTIEIRFSERNDETDNDPFFEQLQKRKELLGSATTGIKHHNKDGLDKQEAVKEIQEATAQGNQRVSLVGLDSEGDKLTGNNEQFQIRKYIDELTENMDENALNIFNSFMGLVNDGIIRVPNEKESVTEKLSSLLEKGLP